MIDYSYFKWPAITNQDIELVVQLLKTGQTSMDEELFCTFEKEICRYFGVKHALLTCNGTSAAFSSFCAIGLTAGDEIIGPAHTHWATLLPAAQLGCRIILADVNPDSFNISVEDVEKKITSATKALVVSHMYGNPEDMDALISLCSSREIALIEDVSHAVGATYNDQRVGSFGKISFFSMQASKIISGGEGGVLLTNDTDLYERALLLGQPKRLSNLLKNQIFQNEVSFGFKFRITPLHALLAYQSFKRLDEQNAIRRKMFMALKQQLNDMGVISFPIVRSNAERVWWEYELFFNDKRFKPIKITENLLKHGIPAGCAHSEYLPKFKQFKEDSNRSQVYPNAVLNYKRVLLLSPFKKMGDDIIDVYITLFKQAIESSNEN